MAPLCAIHQGAWVLSPGYCCAALRAEACRELLLLVEKGVPKHGA